MTTRPLVDAFTSTGHKFFAHEEAMRRLRNRQGTPIVTHLMPTDVCQDTCAFCSVQSRAGDRLTLADMEQYLLILGGYGLKSVILSGGGNPLLYVCPETNATFDDLVEMIAKMGLEIGLITNGMPVARDATGRLVWRRCKAENLDKITWIRISMAGLDHKRGCVEVPDIDPQRTTLGFSYVFHDLYDCPEEPHHQKVSTVAELQRFAGPLTDQQVADRCWPAASRVDPLTWRIRAYVEHHHPRYVRLLPNCLEPALIAQRCEVLQKVADAIDPQVVFVQHKPPQPHTACWLGYIHPVLNADGYVYPCDSVVLNTDVREVGEHSFGESWRICHWKDIGRLYDFPIRSLIAEPRKQCPGCVFGRSNEILDGVVDGTADLTPPATTPEHVNFV